MLIHPARLRRSNAAGPLGKGERLLFELVHVHSDNSKADKAGPTDQVCWHPLFVPIGNAVAFLASQSGDAKRCSGARGSKEMMQTPCLLCRHAIVSLVPQSGGGTPLNIPIETPTKADRSGARRSRPPAG